MRKKWEDIIEYVCQEMHSTKTEKLYNIDKLYEKIKRDKDI